MRSSDSDEMVPSEAALSDRAVIGARIDYLKTLALTILDELQSLERRPDRAPSTNRLKHEVQHFESELIRNAMRTACGAQRRAARILGMSPATLHTKLKRLHHRLPPEPDMSYGSITRTIADGDLVSEHRTLTELMARVEAEAIRQALDQTGGSKAKAARLLGMPNTTLNSKMKKHGIIFTSFEIDKDREYLVAQVTGTIN